MARRIFVGNLSYRTTWQDLKDHFKDIGQVKFADVLMGNDNRSKGCGIVEFENPQEAADAINKLHNSELDGREIFIREDREDFELAQPKEPRQRRAVPVDGNGGGGGGGARMERSEGGGRGPRNPQIQTQRGGGSSCKVFVGNLSWQTQWQGLKDHFNTDGQVTHADVLMESSGRSKGCGIVEFADEAAAQAAIQAFNETELDGRQIFVREDREA